MSPYSILGVAENAPLEDVKKAYRKLVKQYHPDVSPDEASKIKFQEVQGAYEAITSPTPQQPFQGFSGFQSPFGFNFGFHQARPMHQIGLEITIEDAFRGCSRIITLAAGNGPVEIAFDIPPMTIPGSRLKVDGLPPEFSNIDIVVFVMVPDTPKYQTVQTKIVTRLEVDFVTAILGGELRVDTLDGERFFTLPPGSGSGSMTRLPELGFPIAKGHPQRDDFVVIIDVALPSAINAKQREALEAYRAAS